MTLKKLTGPSTNSKLSIFVKAVVRNLLVLLLESSCTPVYPTACTCARVTFGAYANVSTVLLRKVYVFVLLLMWLTKDVKDRRPASSKTIFAQQSRDRQGNDVSYLST